MAKFRCIFLVHVFATFDGEKLGEHPPDLCREDGDHKGHEFCHFACHLFCHNFATLDGQTWQMFDVASFCHVLPLCLPLICHKFATFNALTDCNAARYKAAFSPAFPFGLDHKR